MILSRRKKLESPQIDILRQNVVKEDLAINALIQEVRNCEGPMTTLTELNAQVRSGFSSLRQYMDQATLIEEAETFKKLINRHLYVLLTSSVYLVKKIKTKAEGMNRCLSQITFRKANIAAQMVIEQKSKEALFYCDTPTTKPKRTLQAKEELVKSTSTATDNLLAISQHLACVVEQSKDTLHSLANSSQAIKDNQEEFKGMGSVINSSRKLVSKYGRRDLTDKILLFFALCFFFACCLYVVQKRLF
nr:EOG090X0EO1 [Triops cancriformis]